MKSHLITTIVISFGAAWIYLSAAVSPLFALIPIAIILAGFMYLAVLETVRGFVERE